MNISVLLFYHSYKLVMRNLLSNLFEFLSIAMRVKMFMSNKLEQLEISKLIVTVDFN